MSGLLTTTLANPSVSSYGAVGTTDAYDVYAAIIPDGSYANVSLTWNENADLDLRVYTNSALTTLIGSQLAPVTPNSSI